MANGKGLELVLGDILAALGKIPSPAAQTDAAEGPKWFEQTQETLTTHSQLINDLGALAAVADINWTFARDK